MSKLNRDWIVQPHGKMIEVADGLQTVQGSIVMPLGRFPRRMTAVSLKGGGQLIWSPISLGDEAMDRLLQVGPIRFIVVPNRGHRLDLAAWKTRFPKAKIIAPRGSKTAVGEAAKVDSTRNTIGDPAVELRPFAGLKENEFWMSVERDDGVSLLLNDMFANVRHPSGLGAKVMARLFGFGVKRPQVPRIVRRSFVQDETAVAMQFRELADIAKLRRIIPSHGEIVDGSPAEALRRVASDFES
jgi:hypothetical protein